MKCIVFIILIIFGAVQPIRCQRMSNIIFGERYDRDLEKLTIGVVQYLSSSFKLNCVAIISDEVYLDLFDGEWFRRAMSLSYVITVVKQSEDLLSPNYDTVESIKLVRREGCKLYVILLANGLQASRFVKFGDRHRIVDTRAKFVMMHDFRLFRPDSHYVWKRIVDVVFLRRYAQSQSRFELSTVVYPPLGHSVMLPRRIMTWKRGQRLSDLDGLFENKTMDLKEHVLKAVVLEHVPGVLRSGQTRTGIEIQMINAISKVMNFKLKMYEPPNWRREQWGQKQLNGSFNGLLGEMIAGRADVALGNLHYTPYHLRISDLTVPYITQCLTFLTPESLTDNSWKTLILPFKLYMWVTVIVVLLLSGFIFFGLAKFQRAIIKQQQQQEKANRRQKLGLYLFEEMTNSVLYTYGMLLVVSLPKLPASWSIRLLTGWYWLYCVLVVVSYRASLTAILANPAPRVTIDTMKQLAESSIECGGWGEQSREFFQTSLDDVGQKIGSKFRSIESAESAVRRVAEGRFAYYDNVYFLQHASRGGADAKNLTRGDFTTNNRRRPGGDGNVTEMATMGERDEDASKRNLHIMRECAVHMPISIGLQKNSPLKPRMDALVRRIVEAGLVSKWLDDVRSQTRSSGDDEESVKALMNLQKLYAGFVALACGFTLALLALGLETLHWRRCVRRDPRFDEYAAAEYYASRPGLMLF